MRIAFALLLLVAAEITCGAGTAAAADVIEIARSFPDGGGYDWTAGATGVKEPVVFKDACLLEANPDGSFCCGYTFAVAMRTAEERGLLADKSVEDARQFLKDWYGAPGGDKTLVVLAVENLGIGRAVPFEEAQPGDFVQLWREGGSGHSVIFLHWVEEEGERVGFRYRSSQKLTDGIGDRTEYFAGAAGHDGRVLRDGTYACRLFEAPPSAR
ncbi:hypothetical protein Pla108_06100 [Botrimarina colliarenosi]|uniref:Peptidase C51 domain-containing protein n=1 Tax=Botrimarina colliarenosi TaxID=2528001 RepID=A0A5C6AJK1_9BACT|nr:hypothetical protein [Botrimarina colliarenosi]TWT99667.1 hypothetical protein Pla108_06100 [Botrimarina colliarenosi]